MLKLFFFFKVPTKVRYKLSKGGSRRWWWLDSNQLKLLLPFFYHLIENASMT